MRKYRKLFLACAGIAATGAVTGVLLRRRRKGKKSVVLIGREDGPTSIFFAGKLGRP